MPGRRAACCAQARDSWVAMSRSHACLQVYHIRWTRVSAGCAEIGEEGELAVYNPRGGARRLFKYDRVFGPDSTQEQVYEDTKALIRSVLDGAHTLPQTLRGCCLLLEGAPRSRCTRTPRALIRSVLDGARTLPQYPKEGSAQSAQQEPYHGMG